jgi:cytochrome c peroxidase
MISSRKHFVLPLLALLAGCSSGEVPQSPGALQAVAPTPPAASAPVPPAKAKAPDPSTGARVLLGSPELTAGIPGDGSLALDEIKAWLAADANHQPLEVELPVGLAAGAAGIRIPEDNPLTRAKIELGRQLYFDPRLSADGSVSCADCHHPDDGYARATQFGVGIGGQTGGRNSPVSYNRILSGAQFWDGRAASLEEQAIGPIANPIEMGNTHDACVSTIGGIEGYQLQFATIFGDGVTIENVGKAIASFERVLVTGPSPYDYYEPLRVLEERFAQDLEDLETLKEEDPDLYDLYVAARRSSEEHPMSESARRGRTLFFSERGGCTACHAGANFTDEQYHNLGIGMDQPEPDLGRFVVTGNEKDRGAFKTPTTRNVVFTAPYMHDGSLKTLEEVVEWYDKGGHPNPHLSDKVKKLNLTAQEKQDLVEFMKACTGEFPIVETGRLPQ